LQQHPQDTVVYRSRLNPKINRNFEVFEPVDFPAVRLPPARGS
jgi:hypothetical protein